MVANALRFPMASKQGSHVQVEAYAGASYPERPTAIHWQNQRLQIVRVLRSWRTPEALHFQVEVETLGQVTLAYNHGSDWRLMTDASTPNST